MDLTITLALYATTVFVAGALGFTIGRSVGQKEGFDRGVTQAEVSLQITPYTHVQAELAEVGYSLQLVCKGKPVLRPIDVVTKPETGKKLDKDKEKQAHWKAEALGVATTIVNEAKAAGVNAKLVDAK